jgi:signal transduction histidine kinase
VTAATAAPGGTRVFRRPGWPRLVVLYCVICPPAATLVQAAFWPMWRDHPLLALGSVVLSMALLCAGILLLDEPGQRRSAAMLMAASALLTAGWLNIWRAGPLPLISVPASPAGTILAAWAMFRYQSSPRERHVSSRFFALMLAVFLVGDVFCIAVSTPGWNGFPSSAWWPTLVADHGLFNLASQVMACVGVAFAVSYMVLWLARWKLSRGISRSLALPVALAASTVCAVIIVELVADMMRVGSHVMNVIFTVEAYLQISVPAAFAISVLLRRFTRARIADLLLRLHGPQRVSSIGDALRDVLEDPTLEVVGWAPGTRPEAAEAAAGAAEAGPPLAAVTGNRLRYPVVAGSGERLAVIVADPALAASGDLLEAAAAATSLTLENARLEAVLAGQLREVRESRLRIIQAGIAERRRLEHDLHDGIQQGLQGLHVMLAAAGADAEDLATRAFIGRIRKELALVIEELRDLAHGVHPGVLSQVGLAEAIRTMAGRYTVAIDVDLPPGRFGDDAELTAYYVIAESITNAIKHARASRITVRGGKSGGWLRITIRDNGQGGASADAGTGIRGILDRVRGIGGDAELHSAPGAGTEIRVRIPCA